MISWYPFHRALRSTTLVALSNHVPYTYVDSTCCLWLPHRSHAYDWIITKPGVMKSHTQVSHVMYVSNVISYQRHQLYWSLIEAQQWSQRTSQMGCLFTHQLQWEQVAACSFYLCTLPIKSNPQHGCSRLCQLTCICDSHSTCHKDVAGGSVPRWWSDVLISKSWRRWWYDVIKAMGCRSSHNMTGVHKVRWCR